LHRTTVVDTGKRVIFAHEKLKIIFCPHSKYYFFSCAALHIGKLILVVKAGQSKSVTRCIN